MSVEILAAVPTFKQLRSSLCDDWVDRINHVYTVYLLIVFAFIVSTLQYVGAPIYCWIPAELHVSKDFHSYEDYIHNYCWVKNTYYIPIYDAIPTNVNLREEEEITYYQWVPIILLTQALLFKMPNIIWKMLHGCSGINIDKLCKNAEVTQCRSPDDRKKAFDGIVFVFDKWISNLHQQSKYTTQSVEKMGKVLRFFCYFVRQGESTFLTALYLVVKMFFLANVLGQIFMLNDFVASSNTDMYGIEWLNSFQDKTKLELDKGYRFPRVTMCDINVRQLNNVIRYSIQCVLPINLFNEKIFLFLWFWLILVSILTLYSTTKWVFLLTVRQNNYQFIKKYLKITGNAISEPDKILCKKFAEKYLRNDGCFVARMIAMNSSDIMVTDLMSELFQRYKNKAEFSGEMANNISTEQSLETAARNNLLSK